MLTRRYVLGLIPALLLTACSSTKVSQRQYNTREFLPRPDRILVYDFTANPADVPPESGFATSGALAQAPNAQELQLTHELGAEVARLVAHELEDEGLPAIYAGAPGSQQTLAVNDVVIRGYFVSIDEGSAAKRIEFSWL